MFDYSVELELHGLYNELELHGLYNELELHGLYNELELHGLYNELELHGLYNELELHGFYNVFHRFRQSPTLAIGAQVKHHINVLFIYLTPVFFKSHISMTIILGGYQQTCHSSVTQNLYK